MKRILPTLIETVREQSKILLIGIGMGAADVVPGVSGGTIAFISGIYERLLRAIQAVGKNYKLLFQLRLKVYWKQVDATFLLFLLSGIALSILSLSRLIHYLLEQYPIWIWSFFIGLILASTVMILRPLKWQVSSIITLTLGFIFSWYLSSLSPASAPDTLWYLFICGMIAICAMILPGISGSFILLLLGKYLFILNAIKTFDLLSLIIFACGAVIGLLLFSNILSWLLQRFRTLTMTTLGGIMLGAINKMWPWKEVLEKITRPNGKEIILAEQNTLPPEPIQWLWAALMVVVGAMLVILIEQSARKK